MIFELIKEQDKLSELNKAIRDYPDLVFKKDKNGKTLLHISCDNYIYHYRLTVNNFGFPRSIIPGLKFIKLLVKLGNPNSIDNEGNTCLHSINTTQDCESGYPDDPQDISRIKFLINKVEINIRNCGSENWVNNHYYETQTCYIKAMTQNNQNRNLRDLYGGYSPYIDPLKPLNLPMYILNDL